MATRKRNWTPWIIGGGIVGFGGYLLWRYNQAQKVVKVETPPTVAPEYVAPAIPAAASEPRTGKYDQVQKVGSSGEVVSMIQKAINDVLRDVKKSNVQLTVDGRFGSATKSALKGLTGSESISYNQMKAFKKLSYLKAGLPDPYTGQTMYEMIDPVGAAVYSWFT